MSYTMLRDLPPTLKDDALTLLCGDYIGMGVGRQVYACKFNTAYVVKLETDGDGRFQNHREWWLWNQFKDAPRDARWLAPCWNVSDSGSWLLQARTTPVTLADLKRLAPKVPRYFTDLKVENWGLLEGRVVCHDYGSALAELHTGMRVAKWWVS